MENVKTLTAITYLFKNQMVWLWNFFLSFFPSHFFISICSPSPSLKHLNSFLQLLYWSRPLLQPLNSTTPLLFWQNILSGIHSMPISSFRYEESYMVYIGDISKIHHSFKKSLPMGKSNSSDSTHNTPYHLTSLKTTSSITSSSFYNVDPSNLTT